MKRNMILDSLAKLLKKKDLKKTVVVGRLKNGLVKKEVICSRFLGFSNVSFLIEHLEHLVQVRDFLRLGAGFLLGNVTNFFHSSYHKF